jgi:hypothetical protein
MEIHLLLSMGVQNCDSEQDIIYRTVITGNDSMIDDSVSPRVKTIGLRTTLRSSRKLLIGLDSANFAR